MGLFSVKKYKTIKDKDGNKKQIPKTKEEWNKDTKNGTAIHYFSDRYEVYENTLQFTSGVYELKRDAAEQERIFLNDPIDYILKYGKRSKKKLMEILKENNDSRVKNDNTAYKKCLNDYWTEFLDYFQDFVKETTIYELNTKWNLLFRDEFGKCYPEDITLPKTQELHNMLAKKINKKTNKPYSLSWKNNSHMVLVDFFQFLFRNGKIEINYAIVVGAFKETDKNKNDSNEIRYQTLEQFDLFMSVVDDEFWYAVFNFAFWHGPRKGEQRALTIDDLDLINDTIIFDKTFTRNKKGGEKIGSIKNGKSRTTYLAEQSKSYLTKLVNFYKKMPGYSSKWFLFGGPIPLSRNMIDRKLNYYYKKLKEKYPDIEINELTHHEFGRHSHATLLLNIATDMEDIYFIIAERLGDTPETIRKVYAKPYKNLNIKKERNVLSRLNSINMI